MASGDASGTTLVDRCRRHGEGMSGRPFEDIRYVDVFVIHDGLIAEQHVYNDPTAAGIRCPGRPIAHSPYPTTHRPQHTAHNTQHTALQPTALTPPDR